MPIGKTIGIREEVEKAGNKVSYDPRTGTITLTNPSGRTGTIAKDAYTMQNGRAVIDPSYIGSWTTPSKDSSVNTGSTSYSFTPQNQLNNAQQQQPQNVVAEQPKFSQVVADALVNLLNTYKRPSEAEAQTIAKNLASITVDPVRNELNRQLDAAVTQAELNKQAVNASYDAYTPTLDRMLVDSEKRALQSAVARGGGQSGLVEYLSGEYGQPITERAAQVQAERTNALAGIDAGLTQAQKQGQGKLAELATQQGQIEAQQLASLLYGNDWQTALAPAVSLAGNLIGEEGSNARWITPGGNALLDYNASIANTAGFVPDTSGQNLYGNPLTSEQEVSVRDALNGTGATIDYDYATGEVVINGKRYKPTKVVNGVAYMKQGDLVKAVS